MSLDREVWAAVLGEVAKGLGEAIREWGTSQFYRDRFPIGATPHSPADDARPPGRSAIEREIAGYAASLGRFFAEWGEEIGGNDRDDLAQACLDLLIAGIEVLRLMGPKQRPQGQPASGENPPSGPMLRLIRPDTSEDLYPELRV